MAGFQQLVGVGQSSLFAFQFRHFALRQIQRHQLPQVIAQDVQPGVALAAGLPQRAQVLSQLAPIAVTFRQFRHEGLIAGVVVQQLPLGLAPQQRLVFMLAVDVHQQLAQLPQCLGRLRHAVDVVARTAAAGDHPSQMAVALAG